MGKIFYILSFIILLSSFAYGADDNAKSLEGFEYIHIQDWERDADAHIWSEEVIKGFRKGSLKRFPVNALCNEKAFHEIKEIKRLSLEIIKKDVFKGSGSAAGAVAFKILKKAEEDLPCSGFMYNRIIVEFQSLPQKERSPLSGGFGNSTNPETELIFISSCAGINAGKPEIKKSSLSPGKLEPGCFVYKSKLKLGALWDREETDYYRIFFYIRDSDRIEKLSGIILRLPSFPLLFSTYFLRLKTKIEFYLICNEQTLKSLTLQNCHNRCSLCAGFFSRKNKFHIIISQGVFS